MASVSVTVESIAAGGDGVARAEGFVVFVPRSAPGDVGVVDLAMRGSFARAEFVRLEQPAPSRVEPPCAHYVTDKCGGCQLQHMEYGAQLEAKSGIIRDAIVRIGKRAIEQPEVEPSPQQWRYRRKLTLAIQRSGGRWIAGLHPYDLRRRCAARFASTRAAPRSCSRAAMYGPRLRDFSSPCRRSRPSGGSPRKSAAD
jgi:23S rRNA (uracil1939-C5)-methyltransferase